MVPNGVLILSTNMTASTLLYYLAGTATESYGKIYGLVMKMNDLDVIVTATHQAVRGLLKWSMGVHT